MRCLFSIKCLGRQRELGGDGFSCSEDWFLYFSGALWVSGPQGVIQVDQRGGAFFSRDSTAGNKAGMPKGGVPCSSVWFCSEWAAEL